ncbi:spore cortex biosynthesis protein YabQ [Fictibacillus sp. Mic-4]|uniref:spore cortex biosynthesis protein YabQ n=1 Tax=Fictibacillus TaxID=1329200 RepID=UPI00047C21E9|nr:spore cortex biosynthesis protein YabQ [Fictibacillus gelatini]
MTLTIQFQTMLSMVGMGIWLGMAIDTYGRFVHEKRKWNWLHFINDIFFWVLQGLIVFYVLLHVNHAEIRFYIFVALLCGFSAYKALFQNVYKRLLETVISMIITLYRFVAKMVSAFLIRPVKWLIMLIIALLLSVAKVTWKILLFILKLLASPFKWLGLLIWRFIPKQKWYNVKEKWLKKAGILISLKNKVKNWFRK